MKPVVDLHHHMFAPALRTVLTTVGVDRVGGEPLPPWAPEDSLRVMDRAGIDIAVLSTPVPLQFASPAERLDIARAVNEFGADCEQRWPDRFRFFATLPLPDIATSLVALRDAFDDLGASGVALLTNHAGVYQGDPALGSLYAELDRRHAVAFVHPTVAVGHAMPTGDAGSPVPGLQPSLLEFAFDTTRAVANLVISGTLDQHPNVQFVITHCGGCTASVAGRLVDRRPIVAAYSESLRHGAAPAIDNLEQMLASAQSDAERQLGRLYYDVALTSDPHVLAALTALVPTSHLVLGTDYPMAREIGMHITLNGLDRFPGFDDADRAAIRSTNAVQLLARSTARECATTAKE